MYNSDMKKELIINILKERYKYSDSMVNSIFCKRRKPNPIYRYEMEKKYGIPFDAWADIQSFINQNNNKNEK